MPSESQAKIKDLARELRVDDESSVHWLTELIGNAAEMFPFIGILMVLMSLDIATGIVAAVIRGEVNSSCSFRGSFKKVQMLLLVGAGLAFEFLYPEVPWGRMIAALFSLGEMISIVENAGNAGLPIPEQLRDTLSRLRATESSDSPTVRIEVLQERGEKGDTGDKGEPGKDSTAAVVNDATPLGYLILQEKQ